MKKIKKEKRRCEWKPCSEVFEIDPANGNSRKKRFHSVKCRNNSIRARFYANHGGQKVYEANRAAIRAANAPVPTPNSVESLQD